MATTKDILTLLDDIFPFSLSEDWDNSGLQAGDPDQKVSSIMIGLDVSLPLLYTAVREGSDLILTHHPLMIRPEKSIDFSCMPGRAVALAARHGLSIISAHTNMDKAAGGLNDYFSELIGIDSPSPFVMDFGGTETDGPATGIGRIGYLRNEIRLDRLALHIKNIMGLPIVKITGDPGMLVKCAAVCTGSGGSLTTRFLSSPADVYITGDVKYHEARHAEEKSKAIIDVGHFGSERIVIDLLFDILGQSLLKTGLNIQLIKYMEEKDPFMMV